MARHVAKSHLLFNVLMLICFLPLLPLFARAATLLVRGRETPRNDEIKFLDYRVINTPSIALAQVRAEVGQMASRVQRVFDDTVSCLLTASPEQLRTLAEDESRLDRALQEITSFLAVLSRQPVSSDVLRDGRTLMQIAGDLERIGDHCRQLQRLGARRAKDKIVFSRIAEGELRLMASSIRSLLALVVEALNSPQTISLTETGQSAAAIEEMEESLRNNHVARLATGECAVAPGLLFVDMLHNFEKVAAHCRTIALNLEGGR